MDIFRRRRQRQGSRDCRRPISHHSREVDFAIVNHANDPDVGFLGHLSTENLAIARGRGVDRLRGFDFESCLFGKSHVIPVEEVFKVTLLGRMRDEKLYDCTSRI